MVLDVKGVAMFHYLIMLMVRRALALVMAISQSLMWCVDGTYS